MNLIKSTATVSFFTLLSRISGFLRDVLFTRFFGVSPMTDAFVVAFKIPNFMRRLFAEGSFTLAFIPVLNEVKAKHDKAYLQAFINHVFGCLLAVLLVVVGLFELIAPGVIAIFGVGFLDDKPVFDQAVKMLQIMLPYLLFISLVSFSAGILNSFGKFAIAAATPIMLNVVLIGVMLTARDYFTIPVEVMAWGVLLAGLSQLLMQIPALIRLGVLPKPVIKFNDPEVKKVMTLMVPTLIGSSAAQINLLVDTALATMLPLQGSPTYLYLTDRLVEFPLGLFGIAISTVILPKLSASFADLDQDDYQKTLQWAMSLAMIIALPSAVGLFVLAEPVIITLFVYGEFTVQNAAFTSYSLMVFMFGLPAFVANKVLLPAFYSRKDTKTPVKIALKAMAINVVLNFAFVALLYHYNVVSLHVGLAMAGVSSAWLQCFWLYRKLRVTEVIIQPLVTIGFLFKVGLALLLMVLAIKGVGRYMPQWQELTAIMRFINLMIIISVGALTYFIAMWSMGMQRKVTWK
ncbi:murein biosynthesis integral membrane protein MurJ [Marinicella sp. S1101]|uniref:murein biosynthesis integral membrane protein MurJ n=1 Tax=Marinicella marina TaxID=2996016 RepID=UPI0022608C16|nr:murein biosynthesis integral membrane protein MurJ [Marinicella marina]MCX7554637.1 murein biosynthesis integral membrane protein MurJ [Marinicella marina]MDJ1140702.1 murein biosynthesis integral membrane protein MurJ [Marinicella marina]